MTDTAHEDIPALVPVLTKLMAVVEEARQAGTNTDAIINALLNAQMMVILTTNGDPFAAVQRAHEALLGMVRLNLSINVEPKGRPS